MIELAPIDDLRVLEPHLLELAEDHPDLQPDEVWRGIGAGVLLPFAIVRERELLGHVIFQISRTPSPVLHLVYMKGAGGICSRTHFECAQNFAVANGCVDDKGQPRIRFQSRRKTWARVAGRFGFEPTSTNYELKH